MLNHYAKDYIKKEIEKEKKDTNLLDEYGVFWFYAGVVVAGVLGIIGFIFDFAVVFGIIKISFKSSLIAVIIAVIIAAIVQFGISSPVILSVRGLKKKTYEKKGYRPMIVLTGLFAFVCLCVTIALSLKTEKLVEVFAQSSYKSEIEKETPLKLTFSEMRKRERDNYEKDKRDLLNSISGLRNDRIMWKGKLTTRESSSKEARKKEKKELPALTSRFNASIDSLKSAELTELTLLRNRNANRQTVYTQNVLTGKRFTMGANVFFNLLRVLLIIGFVSYLINASKEQETVNKPSETVKNCQSESKEPSNRQPSIDKTETVNRQPSIGFKTVNRVCANPTCSVDLSNARSNKKYCSSSCKTQGWVINNQSKNK